MQEQQEKVGKQLDQLTALMQEGTLSTGEVMERPYRGIPMVVGALLTGFEGHWILGGSCLICGNPHDTARCIYCQCGICEKHGCLLARASQDPENREWKGVSLACCSNRIGCESRQKEILDHWTANTGEDIK